ncbi:hypothetical protein AB3X52_17780 [Nocardioides sp. DS6]|uniref:Ricin B lectin domain-containing protein n=1 Tax=Nocardioides eburneus TaxID=3231482 RepID=A0ABV3T2N2_9ACTN
MKRILQVLGAAIFAAVFAVFCIQPPAQAATKWSAGRLVKSVPTLNGTTWAFYKPGCSSGYAAAGGVKLYGDYLYVKDTCKDGHSAIVEWREAKHPANRWICKNSHGKGTIVRCNFNWPETSGILIVGLSDGNKILYLADGSSLAMNQNGTGETYPCGFCL